jgi:hypothetical protein
VDEVMINEFNFSMHTVYMTTSKCNAYSIIQDYEREIKVYHGLSPVKNNSRYPSLELEPKLNESVVMLKNKSEIRVTVYSSHDCEAIFYRQGKHVHLALDSE